MRDWSVTGVQTCALPIWSITLSISGPPYLTMTGDGHYGFVTSRSGSHKPGAPDRLSVIDLADPDLKVVQTVKLPRPKMALMHPEIGRASCRERGKKPVVA